MKSESPNPNIEPQSAWPKWLRRGQMENVATALIAAGVLMMLQPFMMVLFTYSFVTTLAGVVMFTIVSKFPE
ncbi:MAG: hypothetical protein J0L51_01720 [Rhizobiales bacterium]|nr:hypothetical protein [Hyphomicrobiales bacterium]